MEESTPQFEISLANLWMLLNENVVHIFKAAMHIFKAAMHIFKNSLDTSTRSCALQTTQRLNLCKRLSDIHKLVRDGGAMGANLRCAVGRF